MANNALNATPTASPLNKKRIGYIDLAKGIAIILVIIGHGPNIPPAERAFLYSFHMPLFFILSGMTFKVTGTITNIKKSFVRLVIPHIIVCVITGAAFYLSRKYSLQWMYAYDYGIVNFVDWLKMTVYATGVARSFMGRAFLQCGVTWFFVCLFWVRIYVNTLYKYVKSGSAKAIILSLGVLAAYILAKKQIYLPANVDIALVAAPMYCLGIYLRKIDIKSVKPALLFAFGIFEIVFLLSGSTVEYAIREYAMPAGPVAACGMSLIFIRLCCFADEKLSDKKVVNKILDFLKVLGKYSLVILCAHKGESLIIARYYNIASAVTDSIVLQRLSIIAIRVGAALILTFLWYIVWKKGICTVFGKLTKKESRVA